MQSITFNSFEDLKFLLINVNSCSDDNNYQNTIFIDGSNGNIEQHINDIFLYITEDEYQKMLEEDTDDNSPEEIQLENSGSIFSICNYINSPPLMHFIMDKNPDIRMRSDLSGNSAIECLFGEYPKNTEVLLNRGFQSILNDEVFTSCKVKDHYAYPIHLLCATTFLLSSKLEVLKLFKKYGVNLNSTIKSTGETALILYLKQLIDDNPHDEIHDIQLDILKELITKDNINIEDFDGNNPRCLINELEISEDIKHTISNMF